MSRLTSRVAMVDRRARSVVDSRPASTPWSTRCVMLAQITGYLITSLPTLESDNTLSPGAWSSVLDSRKEPLLLMLRRRKERSRGTSAGASFATLTAERFLSSKSMSCHRECKLRKTSAIASSRSTSICAGYPEGPTYRMLSGMHPERRSHVLATLMRS